MEGRSSPRARLPRRERRVTIAEDDGLPGRRMGLARRRSAAKGPTERTRRPPGDRACSQTARAGAARLERSVQRRSAAGRSPRLLKLGAARCSSIPAQLWMLVRRVRPARARRSRVWRSAAVRRPASLLRLWAVRPARATRLAERAGHTGARRRRGRARRSGAAGGRAVSDYRAVSVGGAAYAGGIRPSPRRPRSTPTDAGEAHSWALRPDRDRGAIVVVAFAGAGARRACSSRSASPRSRSPSLIDAPKGLDEGATAIEFEGAEATLLGGFWVEIAAGAVIVACGLLLPRYLRPQPQPSAPTGSGRRADAARAARRGALRVRKAQARRRRARALSRDAGSSACCRSPCLARAASACSRPS